MATLILGTVGRAAGGPVGGLVGSFLGSALDRAVLAGPRRDVGRLANLAVQSSAYGEPIPRIYGAMRAAGNVVWTAGITETATAAGGGKGGGTGTTGYSYAASFAVLLSARPVAGFGRVWADGKLIRDASGAWLSPITMRLHAGGDGQAPDPLIAAAEGSGGTPAYRGLACAVFEDLPLADYGNRIPNLTFELFADAEGTDAGAIVADLGADSVALAGTFPGFVGFAAAQAGSIRGQLGQLAELYDLRFADDGQVLRVSAGPFGPTALLADDELGSHAGAAPPHEARGAERAASGQLDDAVAIAFHDPARDYQPGLQRAVRRSDAVRVAQVEVAAALAAETAKGLAAGMLARHSAARTSAILQLPPRRVAIRVGTTVEIAGENALLSVRQWTFCNFMVELAAERLSARGAVAVIAEAGRVHAAGDVAAGPTTLAVLDLPALFGEAPERPRLWIAAAGASPGWRRSGIEVSVDGGETYAAAGDIAGASVMGTTVSALAAGSDNRWDRLGRVEVELLGDAMWLEPRTEAAVLGGANMAVIGDEIVQFADVAALGGRRFALSTLLRGRRASVVATHRPGSRFVLLDPARMLAIDLGSEMVGRPLRVRPSGFGVAATPVALVVAGNALRAPPPVFLRGAVDGGDLVFGWTRRSRAGAGWNDVVDAPLGEDTEAYLVELVVAGAPIRSATVALPEWRYTAGARAADGVSVGIAVTLRVAQLGTVAGRAARAGFVLS